MQPPNIRRHICMIRSRNCKIQIHIRWQMDVQQTNQWKILNHFYKASDIFDAQIRQNLNFQYAQYMGNHQKSIFWPLTYPKPNCTFCSNHKINTWPHLLSTCTHPHIKGLRIARDNKAVDQIAHTLQSNKHTRCYTLVNVGNQLAPRHHNPGIINPTHMHGLAKT